MGSFPYVGIRERPRSPDANEPVGTHTSEIIAKKRAKE